jgi:hypothetical protein
MYTPVMAGHRRKTNMRSSARMQPENTKAKHDRSSF